MGAVQAPVHRLFLIRHGETVDNIAGLYAGFRDSALTNHGFQQATRLGQYFADTNVGFTHIFSSDLSRAFRTAEAIRKAQVQSKARSGSTISLETVPLRELREQNFGYLEGVTWHTARPPPPDIKPPDFEDVESAESLAARANVFIDDHLFPIINTLDSQESYCVAVVSHGMLLSTLWRCLLRRQTPRTVSLDRALAGTINIASIKHLGGWGNTAYLELELNRLLRSSEGTAATVDESIVGAEATSDLGAEKYLTTSTEPAEVAKASCFSVCVKLINSREHLRDHKRTRGGVGSAKYDEGQKNIDTFFKRQKPA